MPTSLLTSRLHESNQTLSTKQVVPLYKKMDMSQTLSKKNILAGVRSPRTFRTNLEQESSELLNREEPGPQRKGKAYFESYR